MIKFHKEHYGTNINVKMTLNTFSGSYPDLNLNMFLGNYALRGPTYSTHAITTMTALLQAGYLFILWLVYCKDFH